MRLIDTQLVLKLIEDIQYDDRYSNNNEVFIALETVRDCVFNLPAAYDVDKVVEELEARAACYDSTFDCWGKCEHCNDCAINRKDATDIVRRGGNK